MQCLYCEKELVIPINSQLNMDNYHNSCVTIIECCEELISVIPITSYKVTKYIGDKTEDDWGRESRFSRIVKKLKGLKE